MQVSGGLCFRSQAGVYPYCIQDNVCEIKQTGRWGHSTSFKVSEQVQYLFAGLSFSYFGIRDIPEMNFTVGKFLHRMTLPLFLNGSFSSGILK